MNTPTSPVPEETRSPVEALTEQRKLLQQWLARLDEVRSDAPGRVAERVRADYVERLRAVTEELGAHRDALEEELRARRAELEEAEEHRLRAVDELEEARLRHLIGELPEEEWSARRPELEEEEAAAEEEVERLRGEAERLDALLAETAGGEAPAPAGAPAAEEAPSAEVPPAAAAPFAEASTGEETLPEYVPPAAPQPAEAEVVEVDLSWLEEIETTALPEGTPGEAAGAGEDDLAFLEELDRAIASTPEGERPAPPAADGDRTLDADRAGMLLCKECGAINDPQAWYCEVCGSEL